MMSLFLLFACTPEPVLEPASFNTLPLASDLATQAIDTWPAETAAFDWIPTVYMFGLHRTFAVSGDPALQDTYRLWLDDELAAFTREEEPKQFVSSDSLSPSLLAATLMWEDDTADYSAIVNEAERYLEAAPRTSQGAIAHWGKDFAWGTTDQVWLDSQFMFGLFWLRQYQRTGDEAYLDAWVEQYLLFRDLCHDETSGLWWHAYDDSTGENIPNEATFWARGNSWVLISAAEYLNIAPADHARRSDVLEVYQAHTAAVLSTQDASGLWHTVLNEPRGEDPDNYLETSAGALIAYSLARGLKADALPVDEAQPALALAVRGVLDEVDVEDDGWITVKDTSLGTNPGDYDYYVAVGTRNDMMLGTGAVLMMLAEVHGLDDVAAPMVEVPQ